MARTVVKERKTKETQIKLELNIDGNGENKIQTGIGFLNHMLELFSKHGQIDLNLECSGDLEVDYHHTAEDIGIVLGSALKDALGDKKGIERYGNIVLPMDETLVQVALDISDRPYLVFKAPEHFRGDIGTFDSELINEFLSAFTNQLRANIHILVIYGENKHHIAEAVFKGLARALKMAVKITGNEIPSTKGVL